MSGILKDLIPKEAATIIRRELKAFQDRAVDSECVAAKANVEALSLRRERDILAEVHSSAKWERDAAHQMIQHLRAELDGLLTVADFGCQVLDIGQEVIDKGMAGDDTIQADDFHNGRPVAWDDLGKPITEPVPPRDPAHRMILRLIEKITAIRAQMR